MSIRELGAAAVLLTLLIGVAEAQVYPRGVIAHCARIVETMHEITCKDCDTYRDSMRLACEAAGGRVLGPRFPFGTVPFDLGPTAEDFSHIRSSPAL
jgi:hypothetical protein